MEERKGGFTDATLHDGPNPAVCYRSGLTVYEEALAGGRYVSCGWNGSGYPFRVTLPVEDTWLNPQKFALPQAFRLGVDGQFLGSHWEWVGFERAEEPKGLHVTVRLRHGQRPVEAAVHTLLDGTAVLTRWLEITNTGEAPGALHELMPMAGALQTVRRWREHLGEGSTLYSLGYMERAHWGNEGNFQWHPLPNAGYRFGGRYCRDRHRHPMFVLKNEATGEHFVCQYAHSAGYAFEFELDGEDEDAHLCWAAASDGPAPLRVLMPGETVRSPEVHMGMVFGGLDDALHAMHTHLRKTVMAPQARGRGGWVESGVGPEVEMTEAFTLRLVDDAADLGAEVFFIDAGWYVPPGRESEWWPRAGDWHADPQRYRAGLGAIRGRVRERGMLFGLWMDAERIGNLSGAFRDHPEWVVTKYDGAPSGANLLDLTNPQAAGWMEGEIARVIEEYGLDFFRLDHNVGAADALGYTERAGFAENTALRYYESLYAVYDRLRARFPTVILENCAGGGGRTDVGLVSRFSHTWVTDWQVAPRSFSITNGMTMALPPEYVDRLIAGQNGHILGSLDFQMRLLLFVRPTVGCTFYPPGYRINPEQRAFVRRSVELYKRFVRPMMPGSRIYHHTPAVDGREPKGWGVLELADADCGRGMLGAFRLADAAEEERSVRLRGANESRRYRVTWDNSSRSAVVDGFTLAHAGLCVRLGGALTSELVLYEAEV